MEHDSFMHGRRNVTAKIRGVGYIRVSTADQSDSGLSLDAQRRKVLAQAEISDIDLIEIFEDAGASAASLERPAMQLVLDMVEAGEIDVIVIAKLDRLSRSVKDLGFLLEKLSSSKRFDGELGIDLISAGDSLDTSTATGRLVIHILGSVSQWEREVIAERTREALAEKKAQGKSTGKAPYGYTAGDEGVLVENEYEQEVLGLTKEMVFEGIGWAEMARVLTAKGYVNRKGNSFTRSGLYNMAKRADIV